MKRRDLDLPPRIGDTLDVRVDEERVQRLWHRTRSQLDASRSRTRTPVGIAAIALAACAGMLLAVMLILWRPPSEPFLRLIEGGVPVARTLAPTDGDEVLRFEEASSLRLSPGSRWIPLRNEQRAFESELERGHVRFEITPGLARRWTVRAGTTLIEVVGTVFDVTHTPERTTVQVERGVVRVTNPALELGVRTLHAGEELTIEHPVPVASAATSPSAPPDAVAAEVSPAAPTPRESQREVLRKQSPPVAVASSIVAAEPPRWETLAAAGRHREAYEALGEQGIAVQTAQAKPEKLMLLADVARLSDHPREAAALLERLIGEHATDPRAPLAAVVLGRLEMDLLHRPDRARRALERALELGAPAALRGDIDRRLAELALGRAHSGER